MANCPGFESSVQVNLSVIVIFSNLGTGQFTSPIAIGISLNTFGREIIPVEHLARSNKIKFPVLVQLMINIQGNIFLFNFIKSPWRIEESGTGNSGRELGIT